MSKNNLSYKFKIYKNIFIFSLTVRMKNKSLTSDYESEFFLQNLQGFKRFFFTKILLIWIHVICSQNIVYSSDSISLDAAYTQTQILDLQNEILNLQKEVQTIKQKNVISVQNSAKVYGQCKLDVVYDSNRTDSGNFIRWVQNKTKSDHQINITSKATRIGFLLEENLFSSSINKIKMQLEIDFYGINGPENRAYAQLRHAFCVLETNSNVQVLFGQTSDLISQLNPNQFNYAVGYHGGNLAYRSPQLRISKFYNSGSHKVVIQSAISRKIGSQTPFSSIPDTGADSGKPVFQSRVEYNFPTSSRTSSSIAIWSHKGKEEFDYNKNYDKISLNTSSLGLELSLYMSKYLNLRAELWKGENLEQFMGGIGQSYVITVATSSNNSFKLIKAVNNSQLLLNYDLQNITPIEVKGGWFEINLCTKNKIKHNLGLSVDDPNDSNLPTGTRSKNFLRWYNLTCDINNSTIIGIEYIYAKTDYISEKSGINHRYSMSMIYKF